MKPNIWFWQRIVSPHMVELAEALAKLGYSVIYVAEQPMSADRAEQGWEAKEPEGIEIIIASNWQAIERGKISLEERRDLAQWAQSLGAKCGAKYLSKILNHKTGQKPVPPWVRS